MLENTEGAIKNGQSRETGNIGYTRRRKTKQKHNTICVGHHYTQGLDLKPYVVGMYDRQNYSQTCI
jgi:hypothetical protein